MCKKINSPPHLFEIVNVDIVTNNFGRIWKDDTNLPQTCGDSSFYC